VTVERRTTNHHPSFSKNDRPPGRIAPHSRVVTRFRRLSQVHRVHSGQHSRHWQKASHSDHPTVWGPARPSKTAVAVLDRLYDAATLAFRLQPYAIFFRSSRPTITIRNTKNHSSGQSYGALSRISILSRHVVSARTVRDVLCSDAVSRFHSSTGGNHDPSCVGRLQALLQRSHCRPVRSITTDTCVSLSHFAAATVADVKKFQRDVTRPCFGHTRLRWQSTLDHTTPSIPTWITRPVTWTAWRGVRVRAWPKSDGGGRYHRDGRIEHGIGQDRIEPDAVSGANSTGTERVPLP
jgi:hypothetical protein